MYKRQLPAYADRKFYETYIAELSDRIARLGAPSDKQRAKSLIEAYGTNVALAVVALTRSRLRSNWISSCVRKLLFANTVVVL